MGAAGTSCVSGMAVRSIPPTIRNPNSFVLHECSGDIIGPIRPCLGNEGRSMNTRYFRGAAAITLLLLPVIDVGAQARPDAPPPLETVMCSTAVMLLARIIHIEGRTKQNRLFKVQHKADVATTAREERV